MSFLLFWITCGLVAAGGVNAQYKADFPDQIYRKRREDLGFSLVWGVVGGPICLILTLGITGFFASGWSLSAKKGAGATVKNP